MRLNSLLLVLLLLVPLQLITNLLHAADQLDDVRTKLASSTKLLVATNLPLTADEDRAFWPLYEIYQRELAVIDARAAKLIKEYDDALAGDRLSDATAMRLTTEMLAIEAEEAAMRASQLPRLAAVLPARLVARYLQLEGKIRALQRYDRSQRIPLVPGP